MKVKKLYARRFPGGSPPEKLAKQPKDMTKFRVAKRMELESILLLRMNRMGREVLPLSAMEPIAVFGNGSVVTNVGGGGSGGSGGSFRIGF